jgi:hypothetical protein
MMDRRSTLLAKIVERDYMTQQLEIEEYYRSLHKSTPSKPQLGRPPRRKLSDLAKQIMANAKTTTVPNDQPHDLDGKFLPRKAKGATA